jgi:hypothetical protein
MEVRTWSFRLARSVSAAVSTAASLLLLQLLLASPGEAQERWKIQFFHDKADSSLNILDLECSSAQRCIAAGVITDRNDRQKGVLVSTRDGGLHWTLADVKENPESLFFLNDSQGWMVTGHGVWATDDGGGAWNKLEALKGVVRVYFLDPVHGYAIGFPKAVYETIDGGRKWIKLEAASHPTSDPKHTVYDSISFIGQHGIILGAVEKDRVETFQAGEASARPEQNSTTAILETLDGGKTWQARTDTSFGTVTRAKLAAEGFAVLLVEYHNYYTLASSVFKWPLGTEKPNVIFAKRDRAVTDVALLPHGQAILAAIEPPGNSNQIPIPAKLKMLQSSDLEVWQEMDVDYRAVARRAVLAAWDAQHMWVATDTGMILGWTSSPSPARH